MNILLVTYLYKVEESLTRAKNLLNEARDAEMAGSLCEDLQSNGWTIVYRTVSIAVSEDDHSIKERPPIRLGFNPVSTALVHICLIM